MRGSRKFVSSVDVLLIDDDESFLDLCSRNLSDISEHNIHSASSFEEASEILQSEEIDCIVCDYDMPGKNGIEVLENIRANYGGLPFILLTAYDDSKIVEEAFRKGADEYMLKDFGECKYQVLKKRIDNVVGSYRPDKKGNRVKDWYNENSLLRNIIDEIPVAVIVRDKEGNVILANEEFLQKEGEIGLDDIVGTNKEDSNLTEEQLELIEKTDRKVLEEGKRVKIEEQPLRNSEGEQFILNTTKIPFSPEEMNETYILSTLVDITERKRRENSLEKILDSSKRMASAKTREEIAEIAVDTMANTLDMPLSGFFLYNKDEKIFEPVDITEKGKEIIGEAPVMNKEESLAGEVMDSQEAKFYEDLREEEVYNPETEILSEVIIPLGSHGILISGSTEERGFDKAHIQLAELFGSVVQAALNRAEREELLREHEDQLKKQNDRLNKFASIISHDLRNPLNIANGYLDMAMETGSQEDLKEVEKALQRMESIVESLLTLAKHTEDFNEETLSMEQVCEEAWKYAEIQNSQLTIEDDFVLRADRDKLMHILENLFSNSEEHGNGEVTVQVGKTENGFYVADNGEGLPEDAGDEIYEFGYTKSEDGTGLGLAIVKNIADFHDWEIDHSESKEGGARFEFKVS